MNRMTPLQSYTCLRCGHLKPRSHFGAGPTGRINRTCTTCRTPPTQIEKFETPRLSIWPTRNKHLPYAIKANDGEVLGEFVTLNQANTAMPVIIAFLTNQIKDSKRSNSGRVLPTRAA